MVVHPLDIAAEQVVRWLKDAMRTDGLDLTLSASRSFLPEDVTFLQQCAEALGEDEQRDLSEVTAIGELEVSPTPPKGSWVLRIRAEDALGARLPADHSAADTPEDLDLADFERLFIEPGRAETYVNVETTTPEDWEEFRLLLDEMRTDRHSR